MTTLYIAGPMTGLPESNYPAFLDAGDTLVDRGYSVNNPANIDVDEYPWTTPPPWDWYMRRALELLVDSDAVCLLSGWQDSKGARLEAHVAESLGMRMRSLDEWLRVAA